jgi:putative ABC transport system permease protein
MAIRAALINGARRLAFFARLFSWFSLRHLLRHPWRAGTVLLGIALGAAVFSSVRLTINASLDSFNRSMELITGKTQWVALRPGGRVPDDLVARLLKHPAVRTASPLLMSYVQPSLQEGEQPFLLIGLDPILDRPLRAWRQQHTGGDDPGVWLELLATPYSLLAAPRLLAKYSLAGGEVLSLEHVHQSSVAFRILGELAPEGLALVEGGLLAVTDIATMQEFTGLYGLADRIDVLLKPAATPVDVEQIRSLLPPGVNLEQPGEARQSGTTMIRAYQLNLSVLSFVSLFVGMFLVYSLVALNAAARRHELATLRSLGASEHLVFLLFLAEGGLLGVAGWLLAIPCSSFLVEQLLERVSSTISTLFVRVQVNRLRLDPGEMLLSFAITLAISLVAAWQPAREAMAVPPKEALQLQNSIPEKTRSARNLAILGLLLIALVWPLAHLPSPSGLPLPGYLATFLLFSGFSLLSPWLLQFLGTCLPPLLLRLAGQSAYLAGRYLRDAGTRTAISVGALITAMALFVALVIMVNSFRKTVEVWVEQTISGDLFVRPKMAGVNDYRDPVPPEVVRWLQHRQTEEPLEILPYRRIYLHYGQVPYQFEAIAMDVHLRHGGFLFVHGNPREALTQVQEGRGVLVSEVFANRTGLGLGSRYRVQLAQVDLEFPVVGVIRDYRTHGGVVFASLAVFQARTGDREWNGIRLFFPDRGSNPEMAAAKLRDRLLECCAGRHALDVTLGGELRGEILRIFDETFAITTVLLLIALLVAALGITTTLTVLVLERSRQLNTLAAIGASFAQIRGMIFWEAILIVAAGECMGIGCGLLLSKLLISVINRQSFGWTFIPSIDWPALAVSIPLILATALLAALPAVRLVFLTPPALALRER